MAKNYIDADLLRKEIEKRLKNIRDYMTGVGMKYKGPKYHKAQGKESAYDALLSIIDSLSQEQQEVDLEKEIIKVCEANNWFEPEDSCEWEFAKAIAHHFYELGQSQMHMPEDTVLFQKGVTEGRRLEKADMLAKAVETTITTNLANRPIIYLDQLHGFEYGDKVKVIVLKDNEDESK